MRHESDNLFFSVGEEDEVYMHWRDPSNADLVQQSVRLEKHQVYMLLDFLSQPEGKTLDYALRQAENVIQNSLARPII